MSSANLKVREHNNEHNFELQTPIGRTFSLSFEILKDESHNQLKPYKRGTNRSLSTSELGKSVRIQARKLREYTAHSCETRRNSILIH